MAYGTISESSIKADFRTEKNYNISVLVGEIKALKMQINAKWAYYPLFIKNS